MESETTRIPARNRREAMDWSLVLLSQGIESVLERQVDGWGLLIAGEEEKRAHEAIQLYQAENRGWPWQQKLGLPELVFDWASLGWVLLAGFFHWFDARAGLQGAGMMDGPAVSHGQWWRLFTAVWLHGDFGHLATNLAIGVVLLGLAMGRFGTGAGLLAAYLAGVGGNVAGWLLSFAPHRSLGASGMVMGALGLLAAQSFAFSGHESRNWKVVWGGLAAGIMLFVLMGLNPGTDVMAHIGGFVCGAFLGGFMCGFQNQVRISGASNLLCGIVFVVLVVVPWWRALVQPAS